MLQKWGNHSSNTSGWGFTSTSSRYSEWNNELKVKNVFKSQNSVNCSHNLATNHSSESKTSLTCNSKSVPNNKNKNSNLLEKFPSMNCVITSHVETSQKTDPDNGRTTWRDEWSVAWMNMMFGNVEKRTPKQELYIADMQRHKKQARDSASKKNQ